MNSIDKIENELIAGFFSMSIQVSLMNGLIFLSDLFAG